MLELEPRNGSSSSGTTSQNHHNALVSAMMSYAEQQFIRALRREPERRSVQVRKSAIFFAQN